MTNEFCLIWKTDRKIIMKYILQTGLAFVIICPYLCCSLFVKDMAFLQLGALMPVKHFKAIVPCTVTPQIISKDLLLKLIFIFIVTQNSFVQ